MWHIYITFIALAHHLIRFQIIQQILHLYQVVIQIVIAAQKWEGVIPQEDIQHIPTVQAAIIHIVQVVTTLIQVVATQPHRIHIQVILRQGRVVMLVAKRQKLMAHSTTNMLFGVATILIEHALLAKHQHIPRACIKIRAMADDWVGTMLRSPKDNLCVKL